MPPSLRDPACEASPGIPAAAAAVASSHMYSPRPVGAGPRVGRSRLRTGADLASHHYAIVPRGRGLPYKVGRHARPQKAAPRLRTWTERKPRPAMMGAVNWPSRASSPVRVQASHPWTSLDSPCSGSGIWDRKCFAELTWTASSCKAPVDLVTGHIRVAWPTWPSPGDEDHQSAGEDPARTGTHGHREGLIRRDRTLTPPSEESPLATGPRPAEEVRGLLPSDNDGCSLALAIAGKGYTAVVRPSVGHSSPLIAMVAPRRP